MPVPDADERVVGLQNQLDNLLSERQASRERRADTLNELRKIVSLIDGIASTMRKLSLNAQIEAVHAGQGAGGFSVIAVEMKNLAGEAQDAVRQAHDLLDTRDRDKV